MSSSIKNIPNNERPREKAIKNGISCLSDSELLAVILGTGSKTKNVMELSINLIVNNKGLANIFKCSLNELKKFDGINDAKALKLLAIKELIIRLNLTQIETSQLNTFQSTNDVYNYVKLKYNEQKKEKVLAFYLNNQNSLIFEELITLGTDEMSLNDNKHICQTAINKNAKKVVVTHNHPSGNPCPSLEDYDSFYTLKNALKLIQVKLLDHLIIGEGKYFSLYKNVLYEINTN